LHRLQIYLEEQMRRLLMNLIGLFLLTITTSAQDKLVGRWEGKVQSMQGERDTVMIFTKEGDNYLGKSPGMRPGSVVTIRDIKIDGDKVTGKADVETPQAVITVNYTFLLQGEAMKGQGTIDLGGQTINIDYNLKRISADTEGPLTPGAAPAQTQSQPQGQAQNSTPPARPQRPVVEQPQQKQSLDYFAGQWTFKYIGRESPLGLAPREGAITFTKNPDGKSLTAITTGKNESGAFRENATITFDEATKMMTWNETVGSGVKLSSKADWSSPISIRFTVSPVKVKGQTLQLRRAIAVIAAHSFSVTEELSEDGGPFVRLGSAVYTKVGAK
jgi:hypothetical protein